MPVKNSGLKVAEVQKKTRTLLALWDLGSLKTEVKRSELTERVKRSKEKAGDYQNILQKLEKEGAIAVSTKNKTVNVSLTNKGLELLGEGLKSPKFEYEAAVGAKTVNALLKWMRHMDSVPSQPIPAKATKHAIASYKEFKKVALEVYNRLNKDYNLSDLVPIYRMRREIGDRVSRPQFNQWLMEMQAEDILQLQGGSVEDSAPDKIEDSIRNELGKLRCYAKRVAS